MEDTNREILLKDLQPITTFESRFLLYLFFITLLEQHLDPRSTNRLQIQVFQY